MDNSFHRTVISILKRIPKGKVATYGQIAALAGNNRGARQVARALHSSAGKEGLPWFRVINSQGRISLPPGAGYELQRSILAKEGIAFSPDGSVDLERYLWKPNMKKERNHRQHRKDTEGKGEG